MFVQLMHRHYGVHEPVKHLELPCSFDDVYRGENNIDEDILLQLVPDGWLPISSKGILISVVTPDGRGTTGQSKLKHFLNWAKYFDAYVLELHDKPLDWWTNNEQT